MDKCREEFEQSPKTKELLSDSIYFDEKENRYKVNADGCLISVVFLNGRWEVWQEQQAKVEELQNNINLLNEALDIKEQLNQKLREREDELQKRVQFLEQELGAWKGKSIAAMINGMCKQCGKEPWQAIVSDKEGYALLHCFGCGANKYELVGEQALKGEG
ncbi:hypothetical protein [Acinetobacter baumannii]|uniref:hypothetical protein n=1 Tax=Acinetobacter baumannii TaxID=470 RepID=UPI000CE37C7D|nr:hypothetical protein [Acinetobacter baumannii]PPC08995.1 hypothetical protein AbaMCR10126_15325 [Acinetobacter baumannii]